MFFSFCPYWLLLHLYAQLHPPGFFVESEPSEQNILDGRSEKHKLFRAPMGARLRFLARHANYLFVLRLNGGSACYTSYYIAIQFMSQFLKI